MSRSRSRSRSRLFSIRLLPVLAGGLVLSGWLSLTAAAQFPFRPDADMVGLPPGDCPLPIVPAEPCAAAQAYAAYLQELQQQPMPPPGRDQQMYLHMLQCLEMAFHQQQRICDETNAAMPPQPGVRPLVPDPGPKPPVLNPPSDDRPYEPMGPIDVGQPGDPFFCRTPELEALAKRPCENASYLDQQIQMLSRDLPPPGMPITGVQELRLRPLLERLRCLEKWRQALHESCRNHPYKDEHPYEPFHPSADTASGFSQPPRQALAPGGMPPSSTPSRGMTLQQHPGCDQLIRQFQFVRQHHHNAPAPTGQAVFIRRQLQQIEMRLRQLCPEPTRVSRQQN